MLCVASGRAICQVELAALTHLKTTENRKCKTGYRPPRSTSAEADDSPFRIQSFSRLDRLSSLRELFLEQRHGQCRTRLDGARVRCTHHVEELHEALTHARLIVGAYRAE